MSRLPSALQPAWPLAKAAHRLASRQVGSLTRRTATLAGPLAGPRAVPRSGTDRAEDTVAAEPTAVRMHVAGPAEQLRRTVPAGSPADHWIFRRRADYEVPRRFTLEMTRARWSATTPRTSPGRRARLRDLDVLRGHRLARAPGLPPAPAAGRRARRRHPAHPRHPRLGGQLLPLPDRRAPPLGRASRVDAGRGPDAVLSTRGPATSGSCSSSRRPRDGRLVTGYGEPRILERP